MKCYTLINNKIHAYNEHQWISRQNTCIIAGIYKSRSFSQMKSFINRFLIIPSIINGIIYCIQYTLGLNIYKLSHNSKLTINAFNK